ncbi:MAG: transposase domain-containing protein [Clostridium sp.]|nr:transposase domain-containing protein [Clostridium sp.]
MGIFCAYLTYLEDGRCSLSNNLSEQKMKSYVIGRKGWLFSDSPEGTEASAISYSIAETALSNGLNVFKYIRYILEKRPNEEMSDNNLEKLLPWNEEVFELCKIEK